MDSVIQNELDNITAAIKAHTAPEAIYLFGSHAGGTPNDDSDIDIYVPDSETDTVELNAKICSDLAQRKSLPIDLLIGRKSIFENRKNRLTLEKVIVDEGLEFMDRELVAEWFRFADADVEEAVKYALNVRDFSVIVGLRKTIENDIDKEKI
jgi:predicted nucleotidyltransferase